jgi:hypothetical protein
LKPGDRVATPVSGDLHDGDTVHEQIEEVSPAAK